jgi:uncharacterized protein YkwD
MARRPKSPDREKVMKRINRVYTLVFFISVVIIVFLVLYNLNLGSRLTDIEKGMPRNKAPGKDSEILSTALELKIHNLVNRRREQFGFPPLEWNNDLREVAFSHSRDMSTNLFFSHFNLKGQAHDDRLMGSGIYYFSNSAENILEENIYTYDMDRLRNCTRIVIEKTTDELASEAVSGWMNSSGHRANILNDFDETGIGAYLDANGVTLYVTQLFIKRVDCGYLGGPCCGSTNKFCYHEIDCSYDNMSCYGKVEKLSPNRKPPKETDKFVPPRVCS